MSSSKLDQIVKGAPLPGASIPHGVSRSPSPVSLSGSADAGTSRSSTPLTPSDPLASLPSSPPQIYLNLLILEASLRSQYLKLRARRRQHTFFLFVLTIWITWFFYALFLRPREDGSGVGGSVYWVVEMAEKVALMGGIVTVILMWGTGQWDRGVKWPRRWVGVANRGLRNINAKIVVIKGPWWKETLGHLAFLFPFSSFFPNLGSSFHYLPADKHDEDLSPGGDYIKLLLLPKPFSADFRENWELYRVEYWEKENERRAHLRQQLRTRPKNQGRSRSGWLWWIPWRQPKHVAGSHPERDPERPVSRAKHQAHAHTHAHVHEAPSKQRRRSLSRSGPSQSRTPSRSSTTPSIDTPDDARPPGLHARRGSSNASGSERRRKLRSTLSSDGGQISRLTPMESPRSSARAGPGAGNSA